MHASTTGKKELQVREQHLQIITWRLAADQSLLCVHCEQQSILRKVISHHVSPSICEASARHLQLQFDDIMVLSSGKIVYHGPREGVLPFFQSTGFACPERKGVADFLQEVTSPTDQHVSGGIKESLSIWVGGAR